MNLDRLGDLGVALIDGSLIRVPRTFASINPATEAVIGEASDCGAAETDRAIAAARRAFDTTDWSRNHDFRAHCLQQLHDTLTELGPEMRMLTTAEAGAPAFLVTGPQFDDPVRDIQWVINLLGNYDGWSEDLGEASPVGMRSHRWIEREAAGVVAAITPWNFPNQINLAKVVPALAAGCTVVLKPAPDTPLVAAALGRIVAERTDIPPGVFNVITSSAHAIGAQLTSDPRVDVISFTGSTQTGSAVMATASQHIARVFLELGGKSAFVVLDDADVVAACSLAAFACSTHAGQGCALTTRLLVPRKSYDEAAEIVAATMASLPASDPTLPGTVCGPVISRQQMDRVLGYLDVAVEEGGRLAAGGGRSNRSDRGFFIDPTLILGLDNTARVAREEIFGPVLTLIAHDGDEDAVAIANDSPYGLSGAVYGTDRERAISVARRIRTGTMGINGGQWYGGDVPFGGFKQSGIGREMGRAGFEEYLEIRSFAEGL